MSNASNRQTRGAVTDDIAMDMPPESLQVDALDVEAVGHQWYPPRSRSNGALAQQLHNRAPMRVKLQKIVAGHLRIAAWKALLELRTDPAGAGASNIQALP